MSDTKLSAGETVSYAQHIKPLFRPKDRQSMVWAFDLWSYEDVKRHSSAILQRLQVGSMPCDGAWPPEKVQLFRQWVDTGVRE